MSYFSADELGRYRGMVGSTLVDSCTLHSKTSTGNGRAGRTSTGYSAAEATFDCRVTAIREQTVEGGSVQEVDRWQITISRDVEIDLKKVIRHGGIYYEILSVSDRSIEVAQTVTAKRSV